MLKFNSDNHFILISEFLWSKTTCIIQTARLPEWTKKIYRCCTQTPAVTFPVLLLHNFQWSKGARLFWRCFIWCYVVLTVVIFVFLHGWPTVLTQIFNSNAGFFFIEILNPARWLEDFQHFIECRDTVGSCQRQPFSFINFFSVMRGVFVHSGFQFWMNCRVSFLLS